MKKNILKVALVAAVVATAGYGVYENQRQDMMSEVILENVEALARYESGDNNTTWQVGDKTIVKTTSPGWTYDAELKVWLLNGKVTSTTPPSTETIKIKCCRLKGDLDSCVYEEC